MKRISTLAVLTAAVWATLGGGVAFAETLEERVSKLESKVAALEATLKGVTRTETGVGGKPTIQFSEENVQIVNGAGSTYAHPNGVGNLVLGYDAKPQTQTGSHDLVVGDGHTFTGSGSAVFGFINKALENYEFVAGADNIAAGPAASVSSGAANEAHATYSSVSGGSGNHAYGYASWVGGGERNSASGEWSSVGGGNNNIAMGNRSSVSGGAKNKALGANSWVGGGEENLAESPFSSIYGGEKIPCPGVERPVELCAKP
jgi:hypothetical protein